MKYGVDVSFYKGRPNWAEAKNYVDFAILGCTEFYGKDSSFEHNYDGCRANGIPVGIYKFSYARSGEESKDEARDIVDILAGRPLDMGVWLDLEWRTQQTFSEVMIKEIIEQFREGIEEGGYIFSGIYCNGYWYSDFIPIYAKVKYKFWIASYPYNDDGTLVESLKPNIANLAGWQYSENGSVPGFFGQAVDMDVWYDDISGAVALPKQPATQEELLKLGSTGKKVKKLQKLLNSNGADPKLKVDGVFGPLTYEAVKKFQTEHNLDVDGIVGPRTLDALNGKKTISEIAQEVVAGKWGNGEERKQKLTEAGYDYTTVQNEVNKLVE